VTPNQVAALLARNGLAPNWRKPIKPAPILAITDTRGAMHRNSLVVSKKLSRMIGWYYARNGVRRTWT
jgi:hypothetical protein